MKQIPLGRAGKFFLVDDADEALMRRHRWRVASWGYPQTTINGRTVQAARLLLGLTDPRVHADHVNGDVLDNRRCNIRPASSSQNSANRRRLPLNTSGFRGVTWHKGLGRWQAAIGVNRRPRYLGVFERIEDAAAAYLAAAREHYGSYAASETVNESSPYGKKSREAVT